MAESPLPRMEESAGSVSEGGNLFLKLDYEGRILDLNDAALRLVGYEHRDILGCFWIDCFVPEQYQQVAWQTFREKLSLSGGEFQQGDEYPLLSTSGEWHSIRWDALVLRNNAGESESVVALGFDMTQLNRVRQEYEQMAELPLQDPNPVMRLRGEGDVALANAAAQQLLGRLAQSERGRIAWLQLVDKARDAVGHDSHELTVDEETYLFNIVPFPAQQQVNLYGTDITELRAFQRRIETLAYQDSLTGIANRELFMSRLDNALANLNRNGTHFALLMLDLDHFKDINDLLGHSMGDRLLVEVSQRLSALLRETDTIARLGGDEFIIIQSDLRDTAGVRGLARRILSSIRKPFQVDHHQLILGTSIGIAIARDRGLNGDLLMQQADIALYEAKAHERGSFHVHTRQLGEATTYRLELARRMALAVEKEQLSVVFQPQLNLGDMSVSGCEALMRWKDSELGDVSPQIFIPIAETHGYIHAMGDWILQEAMQYFLSWRKAGLEIPRVSVNVATIQLKQGDFSKKLSQLIKRLDFPASCLQLEITESIYLNMDKLVRRNIDALQAMGVELSLDDFGTGYSSLSYLNKLPLSNLKIAQELIREMDTNKQYYEIVSATLGMVNNLGLEAIAEGVETEQHLRLLQELNCTKAQGYYIGKPMSGDDFSDFVRNWGSL